VIISDRKKVVVFGTTGELGSRIARGCVDAGHQVVGVSRGQNKAYRVDLTGVELLTGDKGDEAFIGTLATQRQFDVVIDTMPSSDQMESAFTHFGGKIEHYIMCSSTGTYSPLQYCPAGEEHPWREKTPINFYHKSIRDARALEMWEQDGFPVTILRPSVILGRGRVPIELWGGRNILYWQLMKQSKPLEMPIRANSLIQGGCNDDLATAFVNAVAKGSEICGQIYIISSEKAIELRRYFEAAKDFLNSTSSVECLEIDEIVKRRGDDVSPKNIDGFAEHQCFDLSKAKRDLDYAPKFSTEEGLITALKWCVEDAIL